MKEIIFNEKDINKVLRLLDKDDYKNLKRFLSSKLKNNRYKKSSYSEIKEQIKAQAELYKEELIQNKTQAEEIFESLLESKYINFDFQKIFYYDKNKGLSFFIVDFYLKDYGIVVEIDGKHHEDRIREDAERDEILLRNNKVNRIFRFLNENIYNNKEGCLLKIMDFINVMNNKTIKIESEDYVIINDVKFKKRK